MKAKDITERLKQVIHTPWGVAGAIAVLASAALWLLRIASDMEFFLQHRANISWFLQTWGSLSGFIVAALLITKALYDTTPALKVQQPISGESILIDPYLAPGRRTRASVLIDTNNWQAKKLDSSNVFEIKAFFIGDNKTAIQLVVIFDRWTFERGAQIRTDNRLETYGTREDVMTERYAIYSVFGIRPPCIIDIEFQSTPIQPHEPSEPLSLVSEPKPQLAPPASRQPSAYEIEKKLRTLDQFLDFLNTEMRPTVEQGNRVRDLAWEVFRDRERNAAYQEDMEAHIRMVRMNYEAFERLRASSQQYPDIVQTTQQGYGTALEVTASDYMRAFARLLAYLKDDTPHQHFSEIMSERRAALDAALNAFRAWRQRTINTLAEMRRTLAP